MSFKPKYAAVGFHSISIDNFIGKYKRSNPSEDLVSLKSSLVRLKKLKDEGATCQCGNSIWVIGSAITGMGCFTCLTGETSCSTIMKLNSLYESLVY